MSTRSVCAEGACLDCNCAPVLKAGNHVQDSPVVSLCRDEPIHPMPKTTAKETTPHCRCQNCRCHDYNALFALALWDFGRTRAAPKISADRHS